MDGSRASCAPGPWTLARVSFLALALCGPWVPGGSVAGAQCLEGDALVAAHQGGAILIIDLATGVGAPMMAEGEPLHFQASGVSALARDSRRGRLFAVTGDGDDSIYRVDPDTGRRTFVSQLAPEASNLQAMAFAPEAASAYGFEPGALYAVSIDSFPGCGQNCLFKLELDSGDTFPIASIPANQIRGMSFDPLTGELLAFDPGGNRLLSVDASGDAALVATVPWANQGAGTGASTVYSLSHSADGRLFAVDVAFGVLIEIDRASGAAWWIGAYGDAVGPGGDKQIHGLEFVGAGECSGPVTSDPEPTPTPEGGGGDDPPPGDVGTVVIDTGTPQPAHLVFDRAACLRAGDCSRGEAGGR